MENYVKPKILNRKRDNCDNAVYVGRLGPGDGDNDKHFGNPFTHQHSINTAAGKIVPTRADAIQAYRDWLWGSKYNQVEPIRRLWILANLHTLKGKDLACWCSPQPCHASVLIEFIENLLL